MKTINKILQIFGVKLSKLYSNPANLGIVKQKWLVEHLGIPCQTIFDVGANRGQSLIVYKNMFPEAAIHAFEPFPSAFNNLRECAKNIPNVFTNPTAISDSCGVDIFYINHLEDTNSLLKRPESGKQYYPDHAKLKSNMHIPTITIDHYASENNISNIDILKMDIQGGELRALHGAREMLSRNAISIIYTEVFFIEHYANSPLMHDILNFLSTYGFSLYNICNATSAPDGQLRYADVIIISNYLRNMLENK
jgi:FkbM family methyltransferase